VLPHVIEAILNHVSGHKAGVAGIYNRSTYPTEKRAALDLWASHLGGAPVVAITRRQCSGGSGYVHRRAEFVPQQPAKSGPYP
jgi:hypothetical protein